MIVKRGEYYHYQFQINGKRYRGSTKSTNKAEALRLEASAWNACGIRNNMSNSEKNLNLTVRLTFFWHGQVATSNQEHTSDTEFRPNV